MLRSIFIAAAILTGISRAALAQSEQDSLSSPVLRTNITVSSDVVRIGDVDRQCRRPRRKSPSSVRPISAPQARCPYRNCSSALRAHQVIGVDTRDIREVSVTRSSRMLGLEGHRIPDCARAGAAQRPRRCRQHFGYVRARSARAATRRRQYRRHARLHRAV